ncbi:MAG: GDP-L-fucose synthase [Prosthecobacter sp.]|jgi:GDP-L-fucose synthase|uniref:GDP-L-fucose synthase family protein n=1 Tax=Prosthecobacter sp. TaxID=1965333 RepID=UPI001A0CE1F3|nr:GDP-L-fucose synthase [Prosthecobacter sp.]MBE2286578.1 GDP-L-fucose synthase [Prosthecobacter sp.]
MSSSGGKLFITGHNGLVGRALLRHYAEKPEWQIITRTRAELDLRDPHATNAFFETERPDCVILAAAKVGGIKASYTQPVDFLLDNLQIQNAVLSAAHRYDAKKVLFLGSTCIYPKVVEMPIREDSLLTGPMEETNAPYGIAKIAGIKLCQGYRHQHGRDFICGMPANLYGPFDNFDPEHSHVLPSLIRRFHEAKRSNAPFVTLWGSGTPKREFLFVDDLASACAFLLDHYSSAEIINIGCGWEISIREAAEIIREIVGYQGEIKWDTSQPDGNPRRLLDISRMEKLGWKAKTDFREGVAHTYQWFLENRATART